MILILTNKCDSHADHLIKRVGETAQILRINTDSFPDDYTVQLSVSPSGKVSGHLSDHFGRSYDFSQKAALWYRKPHFDTIKSFASPEHEDFIRSEVKSLFEIFQALPNISWLSHPQRILASRSKIQQLTAARSFGFLIPETMITNNASAASSFMTEMRDGLITKSIYSATVRFEGMDFSCTTRDLPREKFDERKHLVSLCPTQFQRKIDKDFELRVTVIGGAAIFTRIDSQDHKKTMTDWRVDVDLCKHTAFDAPKWLEKACIDIVSHFDLDYGAIDLIQDKSGRIWFLEINPVGQYLWIEHATKQDITDCLIQRLLSMLN